MGACMRIPLKYTMSGLSMRRHIASRAKAGERMGMRIMHTPVADTPQTLGSNRPVRAELAAATLR